MERREIYESLFDQAEKYGELGCEGVVTCIATMVECSIVLNVVVEVEAEVKRGEDVELEGVIKDLEDLLPEEHPFLKREKILGKVKEIIPILVEKIKQKKEEEEEERVGERENGTFESDDD